MEDRVLILMRGAQGSGKSTFAKSVPGAYIYSADDYWIDPDTGEYRWIASTMQSAHDWCLNCVVQAMIKDLSPIVVDNTNYKKSFYEKYVIAATMLDYTIYQKVMVGQYKNVHGVPEEKVALVRDLFEVDYVLPHYQGK